MELDILNMEKNIIILKTIIIAMFTYYTNFKITNKKVDVKKLFIISIIVLFFYVIVFIGYHKLIKNKIDLCQKEKADVTSYMYETISNYENINGLNIYSNIINIFKNKYGNYLNKLFDIDNVCNMQNLLKSILNDISFILIIFLGALEINKGNMMKLFLLWALLLLPVGPAAAQEIKMSQTAPLEQVYGETVEDDALLPMNELDMDFGYALYETTVDVEEENPTLTIENVRDYAVVYADGKLQGYLKDSSKSLKTNLPIGIHKLSIYTENIGRITYGPEILDNSKGIYGSITLGKTDLEGWKMTPLEIKECDVAGITFKEGTSSIPCFRKGCVTVSNPAQETFLDVSGWGMGEVWINGQYLGAYWEENAEKTLEIPTGALIAGNNEIVVFELKNNEQASMTLTDKPIFK